MSTKFFDTFGKRVRILRQSKNMTQQELCEELGRMGIEIGRSYVSEWERSEKIPNGEIVAAVAQLLETTADYLLLLSDDESPQEIPPINYWSAEADQIANIVDDLRPERRQDMLLIANAFLKAEMSNSVEELARRSHMLAERYGDRKARALLNFIEEIAQNDNVEEFVSELRNSEVFKKHIKQ